GAGAGAEAAQVRGDHPGGASQFRGDVRPQPPGVREAVEQGDGGAASGRGPIGLGAVGGGAGQGVLRAPAGRRAGGGGRRARGGGRRGGKEWWRAWMDAHLVSNGDKETLGDYS